MSDQGLVYTVRDRSLLLPFYKRLVVEPSLRLVPRSVDPNHITHAGHVINLAGIATLIAAGPALAKGATWPLFVAIATLQIYNWCDNADGAHARRTGQSSALGELLDHGLDMLNTTYIAFAAAIALGAPPAWWTAMAIVVPAACAVTYWEQAETGLFSLGLLNQVESVMVLSAILVVTAIGGFGVWERLAIGPVTLRHVLMGFVVVQASIGILRNVWRVARKKGEAAVLRVLPLIVFDIAVMIAVLVGALAPVAAVIVATSGNVFFGLRSLAQRTAGAAPIHETGVIVGAALVVGLVVWTVTGHGVGYAWDVAASAIAATFFGVLAVANARNATREVVAIDRAARAARAAEVLGKTG
ncbi:MAG: CDP-alcohol phosphatidyltransferase family protein [Deltaproteobacteria bacterium]|nr:CDP-alcohol phosphatidyltransferase family protein [Deltaproteobacteria bacterium]